MTDAMYLQTPSSTAPRRKGGRLRSILGGSAGNLIEWYDWYVYSAFTLYFAPTFFPASDRTSQLLNAAAIFAVGFLMRPLGAWLMGVYADRFGRKRALAVSVTLMCAGSLIIAVAPPYATVGLAAPLILLLARLMQGLSVGGEYGASAVYLSEMAGRDHRGFFSSFQYVTLIAGQLTALCVLLVLQSVLDEGQMRSWGWRLPFALGGVLALAVFLLRRRMEETQEFKSIRYGERERSHNFALFRDHPAEVFTVMALTAGGTLAFYAYSIYLQKFLVNTSGFSGETASRVMTAALFLYMLLQPIAGALSDKLGRKPLLVSFGVTGVLCTIPIFHALENIGNSFEAFLLVMAGLVIVTGYTSINAVVKAELFPAEIRTMGVALPYALANTLFGGTAEYVALSFKRVGLERGFYWYVTAMIGLSLIVYLCMRDTLAHGRLGELDTVDPDLSSGCPKPPL